MQRIRPWAVPGFIRKYKGLTPVNDTLPRPVRAVFDDLIRHKRLLPDSWRIVADPIAAAHLVEIGFVEEISMDHRRKAYRIAAKGMNHHIKECENANRRQVARAKSSRAHQESVTRSEARTRAEELFRPRSL
ncbi:hypothetical protein [Methylocystis hirsuta]|uniref:hypothetical protein n=1 Tax=Methylocystis hirsuta TaxID=369798 RepID=UPI001475547D|nr:hypothetical protein [Methylocystis hirsuta]